MRRLYGSSGDTEPVNAYALVQSVCSFSREEREVDFQHRLELSVVAVKDLPSIGRFALEEPLIL